MGNKILLVEDDRNFGDVLKSYLEMNDYEVTLAIDGEMGLKFFNQSTYDLCIFDVMMPKKDGFTLAKEVKEKNKDVPIVFLTAKTLKEDVIDGFKLGADDYITKPFNSEELLYRVQAIIKRSNRANSSNDEINEFSEGEFVFNYPLRTLKHSSGKTDKLSPKEAQLLRLFLMKKNQVLTRNEALTKIWGDDNYFNARSMDVFVTKLRKYLKLDPKLEIVNIHGSGFRLVNRNEVPSTS